jgi:hypothetical protein
LRHAFLKSTIQPEPLNQEVVNERIQDAARGISGIRPVSGVVHNTASNTDYVQTVLNEIDIWTAILRPLKTFNSVAGRIGEVHILIPVEYMADLHVDSSISEGSSDYFDWRVSGALIFISSAWQVMTNVLMIDHN